MGNLTPAFDSEIFRKDYPVVLACNRHLALLLAVNLRYKSDGYRYGEVIARNTTDDLYDSYSSSGSSGLDTAAAILLESVDFGAATSGTQAAVAIFGGQVYESAVSGLDSGAKTDLNGVSIKDAFGTQIFKF